MVRVVFGAFLGICAALIAPAIGTWVTGVDVIAFARRKNRNRWSTEVIAVIAIFAAVFTLIPAVIEGWAVVVAGWVLSMGLLTASWIDVHTHRLPRSLSYLTFGVGAPLLLIAAIVEDDMSHAVNSVIGVVVATALVGVLYLIGRGALGSGDVRLAPVVGLYSGWISVSTVALALVVSFFLAAIFALALLVLGRANRRDEIPFGPFLAMGTLAVFVYSAANYGL